MSKVNAIPQPELLIVGVEVYKNDLRVIRKLKRKRRGERKQNYYHTPEGEIFTSYGIRQPIEQFTKRGQKSLAFTAQNTDVVFTHMITLTYPSVFPTDGKQAKKHLHAHLAWLRRRGCTDYLWFLEFQKRGAPHFHVLITNGDNVDKHELSTSWFGIVGGGDEKHLHAGTRIERGRKSRGLHNYAVKYAQKAYQKTIPEVYRNVGALWNCSNSVRPVRRGFVPLDCEQSLSDLLQDWQYSGKEQEGYNILFNASPTLLEKLNSVGASLDYFGANNRIVGGVGDANEG